MSVADNNTLEVTLSEICKQIKEAFEDEQYDPILVLGPAGVGKTESLKVLAKEIGVGYRSMRLVDKTALDIIGLPDIEQIDAAQLTSTTGDNAGGRRAVQSGDTIKTTTYHANTLLPYDVRDGERGIFVIDEITSAQPDVLAPMMQLMDNDRSIGTYKLPPKWKIVAIGNGEEDGGYYEGVAFTILNRSQCYRLRPDFESWKLWAIKNGVNPSVVAYLSLYSDELSKYDNNNPNSLAPTPRAWEKVSKKLTAREKGNQGSLDPEDVYVFAAGFVGKSAAGKLRAFYEYNKKLEGVSPADILAGKCPVENLRQLQKQALFIVLESVVKQMKDIFEHDPNRDAFVSGGSVGYYKLTDNTVKTVQNVVSWAMDVSSNLSSEYGIMVLRDLTTGVEGFSDLLIVGLGLGPDGESIVDSVFPGFAEFAAENGKYLIA